MFRQLTARSNLVVDTITPFHCFFNFLLTFSLLFLLPFLFFFSFFYFLFLFRFGQHSPWRFPASVWWLQLWQPESIRWPEGFQLSGRVMLPSLMLSSSFFIFFIFFLSFFLFLFLFFFFSFRPAFSLSIFDFGLVAAAGAGSLASGIPVILARHASLPHVVFFVLHPFFFINNYMYLNWFFIFILAYSYLLFFCYFQLYLPTIISPDLSSWWIRGILPRFSSFGTFIVALFCIFWEKNYCCFFVWLVFAFDGWCVVGGAWY